MNQVAQHLPDQEKCAVEVVVYIKKRSWGRTAGSRDFRTGTNEWDHGGGILCDA